MKFSEGRVGMVFAIRLEDGHGIPECIEGFAEEKKIVVGQEWWGKKGRTSMVKEGT